MGCKKLLFKTCTPPYCFAVKQFVFLIAKFYYMKKCFLFLLLTLCVYFTMSQIKDYKVVFDFTSSDSINQQTVVRQVDLIKKANPDSKLQVVVYGQGMSLVLKGKSTQPEAIQKLAATDGVSIKVCSVTLKRHKVDESQLLAGVQLVPDGIYEIISKQKEGWGYIKVAH